MPVGREASGSGSIRMEKRGKSRSWSIYLSVWIREKPKKAKQKQSREVHKKRGKLLRKEAAPSNDDRTIKHPMEEIN